MKRRRLLAFGMVAGLAATLGYVVRRANVAGGASEGWMHEPRFEDLAGKPRRLDEWPARLVLLNFWATWCAPCREEIPLLIGTSDRLAARGLQIIGIAIDLPANVVSYAQSLAISYPVLVAERRGMDLMRSLGNPGGGLPFSALVDGRGVIAARKLGAFGAAELDELLRRLLA